MKRLLPLLALFLAPLCSVPAAPGPAKGGPQIVERNLSYCRVHVLPDDLPSAVTPGSGALVLDLRFVSATPEAAAGLAGWLKIRARPQAPVLVLVNHETAPALLGALTAPGVVSIGPADAGAGPDVALKLDAEADRAAYEALDQGTPLNELINPKVEKVRHDEAAMAKERAGAGVDAEDEPAPATAEKSPAAATAAIPAPPVDRVLQRAVQLYHALLALKKIP